MIKAWLLSSHLFFQWEAEKGACQRACSKVLSLFEETFLEVPTQKLCLRLLGQNLITCLHLYSKKAKQGDILSEYVSSHQNTLASLVREEKRMGLGGTLPASAEALSDPLPRLLLQPCDTASSPASYTPPFVTLSN